MVDYPPWSLTFSLCGKRNGYIIYRQTDRQIDRDTHTHRRRKPHRFFPGPVLFIALTAGEICNGPRSAAVPNADVLMIEPGNGKCTGTAVWCSGASNGSASLVRITSACKFEGPGRFSS